MRKIIILCSILLIAIVAISIKYFSEINRNEANLEEVLDNIPQDAALVLNFSNNETFHEIFRDYELFDAIIGQRRAAEINQIQQVLLQNPKLVEASSDKNIFITFHPDKADSISFLYSIDLHNTVGKKEIEDVLLSISDLNIQKSDIKDIYTARFPAIEKPFYLYITDDAAYGSFSKSLLALCVDKKSPKLDQKFIEEINNTGRRNQNSPVNLFINHNQVYKFISHFLRGKASGNSALLTNIKGISSLNMNFKSDALMFNGISSPDTSTVNYLNLFLNQKPVRNDIKNILPENTANFIAFGVSNYNIFKNSLNNYFLKRNELSRLNYQFKLIKDKTGYELDKEIKPLVGNEFSIIETSDRQKIGIIKVKNGRQLALSLQPIRTELSETINRFDNSYIPYYFFGDPFKSFLRPYFSIIDNYLIISNTQSTLQNYLDNYQNGRFLIKTPMFSTYNQLVANQSNILFFANNENSEKIIKSDLKEKFARAFYDENYGLKNFYGFSYQWSADKEHFFTNIYINYVSKGNEALKEAWKFQMDGALALQPQIIELPENRLILVQDARNNVFALSEEGKKLWDSYLPGKVQGEFQLLNDNTILFNTENKLYRKNVQGEDIQGYPVDLPYRATYSASVININDQDSKIFIPAGKVIMGFNKDGKALNNWNKTLTSDILFDLKTASQNDVNYLIAGTKEGSFYFFNHNGNLIYKFDDKSGTQYRNRIFLELTPEATSSKLITTDTSGTFTSINFKGDFSRKILFSVSNKFIFEYKNISGDEQPEAIYLDQTGLNVFTKDGIPSFIYNFSNQVSTQPLFFPLSPYKYQLAISDSKEDQLLVFNEDGTLAKGFPVKGKGYFLIGKFKNGLRYLISSGKDGFLQAWKL